MHCVILWKVYEIHVYPYVHEEIRQELEVNKWSEAICETLHEAMVRGKLSFWKKWSMSMIVFMQLFQLYA